MNLQGQRLAMMMRIFAASTIAFFGVDGCSTTPSPAAAGTCGADPSVSGCAAGDGYSCPAATTPDSSLTCSLGVAATDGSGSTLYCCYAAVAFPSSTCSPDPSLDAACPDPATFGYACTPGDNPMTYDASLSCSVDSAGTGAFCCITSAGSSGGACTTDPTLPCGPGTDGWTCTSGTAVPAANGVDYICSVPQQDSAGNDTYCCATTVFAAGTCTADSTVSGCAFPSLGFSCAGTDTPDQTDSSLVCSTGTADPTTGDTVFCCCTGGSC